MWLGKRKRNKVLCIYPIPLQIYIISCTYNYISSLNNVRERLSISKSAYINSDTKYYTVILLSQMPNNEM